MTVAHKAAEDYGKKAWQEVWAPDEKTLSWFLDGCPGEDGKLLAPCGPPSQELVDNVEMKALQWLEQRTTRNRKKIKKAPAASKKKKKKLKARGGMQKGGGK